VLYRLIQTKRRAEARLQYKGCLKSAATGIDTAAAGIHVVAAAGVYVRTATAGAGFFLAALFLGLGFGIFIF
jgi:hypothetical protein